MPSPADAAKSAAVTAHDTNAVPPSPSSNTEDATKASLFLGYPACSVPPEHVRSREQNAHTKSRRKHGKLRAALYKAGISVITDAYHGETLGVYDFHGTSISPTSIFDQMTDKAIQFHIWVAAKTVLEEAEPSDPEGALGVRAVRQFLVEVGCSLIDFKDDTPHLTFVEPSLWTNKSSMVTDAMNLLARFKQKGIPERRVIVQIPASQEGIAAAIELHKRGIQVSLTHVTNLTHAIACSEAKPTAISVAVGPLLEWHGKRREDGDRSPSKNQAVRDIQTIIQYWKRQHERPLVLASDIHRLEELRHLNGLDAVTLSRTQIAQAQWSEIHIAPPPPKESQVSIRAATAQRPDEYLAANKNRSFSSVLSSDSLYMIAGTQQVALGVQAAQMLYIRGVVWEEMKRQLCLTRCDVAAICRRLPILPSGWRFRPPRPDLQRDESDDERTLEALYKGGLWMTGAVEWEDCNPDSGSCSFATPSPVDNQFLVCLDIPSIEHRRQCYMMSGILSGVPRRLALRNCAFLFPSRLKSP